MTKVPLMNNIFNIANYLKTFTIKHLQNNHFKFIH